MLAWLKVGLPVVLMLFLFGCATLSWYGQAARGQLELLSQREDIAEMIADPGTPPELRARLAYVLEVREFASSELGLPDSRSYRLYADLDRDAAVWNVVATPRFSMQPKTWCFPIAGCVAYRGYFNREAAESYRAELLAQGYDAAVFPATAYSTLGWFADPVLNTMLHYDDVRLAGLVFHELTHEKLYVRGDTAFSEAYATFIEREGIRRWLEARGSEQELDRWKLERELDRAFIALLLEARAGLIELYARDLSEPRMALEKARAFERLRTEYHDFAAAHGTNRYAAWFDRRLNNAHLAMVATYESGVEAFAHLLAQCGGKLSCLHQRARELASRSAEERRRFLAGGQ